MPTDRPFTNPDFGNEVRVEQLDNNEVHLIFVAKTEKNATELTERLLDQLKTGALNLTLMGKVTSITYESADEVEA